MVALWIFLVKASENFTFDFPLLVEDPEASLHAQVGMDNWTDGWTHYLVNRGLSLVPTTYNELIPHLNAFPFY